MIAGVCPAYLPSIRYMAWMAAQNEVAFVKTNNYQKQTYRNRTEIYGPNGKLKLTIPILHKKNQKHQLDSEVEIFQESSWQKNHWKSLESSYRSSPFFEFYEDDLYPFFHQRQRRLMDLNISLIKKIFSLIDIEIVIKNTKEIYEFRELLDAKKNSVYKTPIYNQVFNSKHGYINNLSILDLIFNLGPDSNFYLKKIQL
tara:strand:- start:527 stop:1123 length:597 start_codon:yes stop_codon:yes gene_type:complete